MSMFITIITLCPESMEMVFVRDACAPSDAVTVCNVDVQEPFGVADNLSVFDAGFH